MIGGRRTEKPESIITRHKTGGEAMEGNTRAETKKPTLRRKEYFLLKCCCSQLLNVAFELWLL